MIERVIEWSIRNRFLVFILGSGLCGLAPGLGWLIAFRVLQAVGAAMLQANSVAMMESVSGRPGLSEPSDGSKRMSVRFSISSTQYGPSVSAGMAATQEIADCR